MLRSLSLILGAAALIALAGCGCDRDGACCGGKPGCKGGACTAEQQKACCPKDAAKACPPGCTKPCCAKPATAADAK